MRGENKLVEFLVGLLVWAIVLFMPIIWWALGYRIWYNYWPETETVLRAIASWWAAIVVLLIVAVVADQQLK